MPLTAAQEQRRGAILAANQALIGLCHELTQREVRLSDLAEDTAATLTAPQLQRIVVALRTIFDRIDAAHSVLQGLRP